MVAKCKFDITEFGLNICVATLHVKRVGLLASCLSAAANWSHLFRLLLGCNLKCRGGDEHLQWDEIAILIVSRSATRKNKNGQPFGTFGVPVFLVSRFPGYLFPSFPVFQ